MRSRVRQHQPPSDTSPGALTTSSSPGSRTLSASSLSEAFRSWLRRLGLGSSRLVPPIDLDPTDVEVYGKNKLGVAFNYAGQRFGRAHPAIWAETGLALAADLGSRGTDDPRPEAPSLIDRAPGALPEGLEEPIFRGDSVKRRIDSFFMCHLALPYSHSNKGCVSHVRWASTNRRLELTGHHRRWLW
ncbi:MAG: hypothetical protein ACYDEY_02595 [Acidimicrobiales bacterium]